VTTKNSEGELKLEIILCQILKKFKKYFIININIRNVLKKIIVRGTLLFYNVTRHINCLQGKENILS